MFRLFTTDNNGTEKEVYPENGIYIVYESYNYKFNFSGLVTEKTIFIEDEVFDPDNKFLIYEEESIAIEQKTGIFKDYFGYVKINISNNEFNFDVRITKLRVQELEEILLYLWNQDPIIFDNFFSRSTQKAKLSSENSNLSYSSKFVNIFEDYYTFFKNSLFVFQSLPHNVLRTKGVMKDYELAEISNNSIDWLINNLDEVHIDYSYKNFENAIQINNSFGVVEKIYTEDKINDFNVYENQVILGSFDYVNSEISKIKDKIKGNLSKQQSYEKGFYSINDFKIIPYLKLREDLDNLESKIKALQRKYKEIFKDSIHKNVFPKLTSVFANKKHYTDAYNKIKLIRDFNINIDGELNLINIKKLSELYERFNLFVLVNAIKENFPISWEGKSPKSEDEVFQEFYFQFSNFTVSLYYDNYVGNSENHIGLQRISKTLKNESGYYKPDYIIKVENDLKSFFYILDAKYSTEKWVKSTHLPKCIEKYILDIGITGLSSGKVEELILIYPGNNAEVIFGSDTFRPKISILPSKVNKYFLKEFIGRILGDII